MPVGEAQHALGERSALRQGVEFATLTGFVAAAFLVAFGLAVTSCARAVDGLRAGFALTSPAAAQTVTPVPVPAGSCPALDRVRATAAAAERPWFDGSTESWPRFSRELGAALPWFAAALTDAIPRVPGSVAVELRRTLVNVQFGLAKLRAAGSYDEYLGAVVADLIDGNDALVHAGELVGSACGPPLPAFGIPGS
ncbi:MAG TPA: hypothetical protein VN636_05075 [Acidimicrobiia bacterium]|nr:hypothetical protein [Acidimicrobiia bacterium]